MINPEPMPSHDFKTLSQRMGEGRLPVAEALRYAMLLGDTLRGIHDSGKAHGAVTPLNIKVTSGACELLPAPEWSEGTANPYTAPEVLLGCVGDKRSDIFSYGALLFEMLTGRRAFEAEGRANLIDRITNGPTPCSGNLAVDRLVGPCLMKRPDARSPRMQRVMMELKLFAVAARRANPTLATAGVRREPIDAGALRAEMKQLEGRMAARTLAQENTVIALQRSSAEAVLALRGQLALMGAELACAQSTMATLSEGTIARAAGDGILSAADDRFEAVSEQVRELDGRVEEIRRQCAHFERSVAADLVDIEQGLKAQGTAVDASRMAMSQTDDLVERVVEALESLQTAVLKQEEPAAENAIFAAG